MLNERLKKIDAGLIFLFLLPALITLIHPQWVLAEPILTDGNIYLGYFLDLKQHLHAFHMYYSTRLPWILFGFLVYHLFSPVVAAYVLHLIFYYASIISLYLILQQTVGQRGAISAAVLMGIYFQTIALMGSNYISSAGVSFFLLLLLMLINAARRPNCKWYLFVAGIFYGCVIYTQLFLIVFTPLIAMYYLFFNHKYQQHLLKQNIKYFLSGFIGWTVLLCAINCFLTGKFFFFMPVLHFTKNFLSAPNQFWVPISSIGRRAVWLFLPSLLVLLSIITLVFPRITKESPVRAQVLFFQIFFILSMLIFIIFQIIGYSVLALIIYENYLLPAMFLALGALLTLGNRQMLGVAMLLFTVLSFWLLHSLSLANFRFASHSYAVTRAQYLAVIDSIHAIQSMTKQDGQALFWFDQNSRDEPVEHNIVSAYLWVNRLVNIDFPKLDSIYGWMNHLPLKDAQVFILSHDKNAVAKANRSLKKFGLRGDFTDQKTISEGSIKFNIALITIKKYQQPE